LGKTVGTRQRDDNEKETNAKWKANASATAGTKGAQLPLATTGNSMLLLADSLPLRGAALGADDDDIDTGDIYRGQRLE
jgi:hypothetical protein